MDQLLVARQLRYENPNPDSFEQIAKPCENREGARFAYNQYNSNGSGNDSFENGCGWFGSSDDLYDDKLFQYSPAAAARDLGSLHLGQGPGISRPGVGVGFEAADTLKSPRSLSRSPRVQFWDGDRVWDEGADDTPAPAPAVTADYLARQREMARRQGLATRRGREGLGLGQGQGHERHTVMSLPQEEEIDEEAQAREPGRVVLRDRRVAQMDFDHEYGRGYEKPSLKVNKDTEYGNDISNGSRRQERRPNPNQSRLRLDYGSGSNRRRQEQEDQDHRSNQHQTEMTPFEAKLFGIENSGRASQLQLQLKNGVNESSKPRNSDNSMVKPSASNSIGLVADRSPVPVTESNHPQINGHHNGKQSNGGAVQGMAKPIALPPAMPQPPESHRASTSTKSHNGKEHHNHETSFTTEEATSDDSNHSVASVEVLEEELQSDVSEPVVKLVKKKQPEVILRTEFDDVLDELAKYIQQKAQQAVHATSAVQSTSASTAQSTSAVQSTSTPQPPRQDTGTAAAPADAENSSETQEKEKAKAADPSIELLKKLTDKMTPLKTPQLSRSLKTHLSVITHYVDTKEGMHHLKTLIQKLNPRKLVYVPDMSALVLKLIELEQPKTLIELRDGFSTLHVSNGLLTVVEDGDHDLRSTAMDLYTFLLLDSMQEDEFDLEEGVRVALHSLLSPIQAVRHSALECLTVLASYFKTPIKYYKSMAPDRVVDAVDVRLKRKLMPKIKNGKLEYGYKEKDIDPACEELDIAWIVKGDLRRRRSTLRKKSLAMNLAAVKSEDGDLLQKPMKGDELKAKPRGQQQRGQRRSDSSEEERDRDDSRKKRGEQSEPHSHPYLTVEDMVMDKPAMPRKKSDYSERIEPSFRTRDPEVTEPRQQQQEEAKNEWSRELQKMERKLSESKYDKPEPYHAKVAKPKPKPVKHGSEDSLDSVRVRAPASAQKPTLERGSSTDSDFIRRPVRAGTVKKPIKVYVEDVDNDDNENDNDRNGHEVNERTLTRSRSRSRIPEKVDSIKKKETRASKSCERQSKPQKPLSSTSLTLLTLSQLSSSNWETVLEGFATLNKLLQVPVYKQDLHLIILSITNHVGNLRSQVARAAIQSCTNLVQKFGEKLEQDSNIIAEKLLDRTSDTNKFIRSDAINGLQFIIATSSVQRCMNIIEQGAQHRNGLVRATVGRLTLQFIHRVGVDVALGEYGERLLPMLIKLLQDGSQEARAAARLALIPLASSHYFESGLKRHVPYERLRMVSKFMTSIKADAQKQQSLRGF